VAQFQPMSIQVLTDGKPNSCNQTRYTLYSTIYNHTTNASNQLQSSLHSRDWWTAYHRIHFRTLVDKETDLVEWLQVDSIGTCRIFGQIYPVIQETRYLGPKARLPWSYHFFESQIHCMGYDRFNSFFRMSRSTFKDPVGMIENDPVFKNNSITSIASNSSRSPPARPARAINSTVRPAEQLGLGEGTLRLYLWKSKNGLDFLAV